MFLILFRGGVLDDFLYGFLGGFFDRCLRRVCLVKERSDREADLLLLVIDVDDLTDSQEETEEKVDGVNHQLLRLLKVVSKYNDAIDKQNQEIEALKKEFERRNPTEEEQLNIRSQAGYPYSEKPKEYWEKKVKDNPNYDVMFDNDVPTDKEQEKFEIKDSDLNGINYKDVSDSFDDDMKLSDFLNF